MTEAKGLDTSIATAARERLTKERDAFWARKVGFVVAMKVALHALPDEGGVKVSALTILGHEVFADLTEHYGKDFDMAAFMADAQQLMEELMAGFEKTVER